MAAEEKERLNIYLPKDLAEALRRHVPARERTRFIVEVLRRELRKKQVFEAIDQAYGAWSDENHPELATPEDIDRWIEDGRSGWERPD